MSRMIIKGSFVVLVTPFKDDGSVDIEGFRKLIDFQALHGTSALLIMGSTGEVSLLSKEERQQIISETVKFRKAGMPLFYSCTGNNTQDTINMVKYAAKEGADGAIITVPSYIYAPVDAAIRYFLEIADTSPIPIGIYNNPVPVKSLAKALGLPAGNLCKPYLNMTGKALRRGEEIARNLGLVKQYNFQISDDI